MLKPQASLSSRAGQFKSYLVGYTEDRFSRDVAQIEVCTVIILNIGIDRSR